ncbi:TonB-dependent receptor domain-containing protein [Sphingomonas beigongshangi]|uniref:TonB-dependent receptor domain-containing protein n=1 Tax=Sphingomonas beigongshangi TaxID=2782540 RepID=UPI001FEDC873|nr:TonB-dependent receptor [Sphingomonas beigongshangi]
MTHGIYLRRSAALIALATGLMTTHAASAQTAAPPPDSADAADAQQAEKAPDEIIVTGTRIRRPELLSNSPLTTVSSQELALQGTTNIETALNRLPQFTADDNENISNGASGTAQINLRNLGSNRVLTLINGQRMLPTQATDINFVPSALIERVDVSTGGASAVYGSDALSGVVNFILRDRMNGIRLDAQSSVADHTNDNDFVRSIVSTRGYQTPPRHTFDAAKQDINGAFGKDFFDGRLNITVYGGYRHTDPVLQATRDVSACALNTTGASFACGGSSNTPYGTFVPLGGPYQAQRLTNNIDGTKTWVPYVGSVYAYNYAPLNYFQRIDDRVTGGAFLHAKVVDAAEVYGSFMYMRDRTFSQVAPSALFQGSVFTIPCNNPLMSASQQQMLCGTAAGTGATQNAFIGYRLGGNGTLPRRDNLQHEYYRYMVGVRGDLGSGFSYDVSVLRTKADLDEQYLNDVNVDKANKALYAVSDGKGGVTCQSVLNGSDPNCIPINVFQAGGLTAQQASYLYAPTRTMARTALNVINGSVTGDLGKLGIISPWARDGVGIVIGGEHRRETLLFQGDAQAKANGTQDSDGIISVNEAFGEIELPLIQDKPAFRALTVNGGFRYSAYKNHQDSTGRGSSYNAFTYKGELNWQLVEPLRLRASLNHALRAPNVTELFAPLSVGNVNAADPCAGTADPRASLAACQLSGVTAAQYNNKLIIDCPAGQCSGQFGGNVAVKPETADTLTGGIVLAPNGGRTLSLSVDYYRIKVKDYIGSIDTNTIINQCIKTGSPYYCSLFHRDPITGTIFGTNGYVVSTTLNTGYLLTSGLDFGANLNLGLGRFGKLNAELVGTWLFQTVQQPLPGGGTFDCTGLYGFSCGQPQPEWRHNARLTWSPDRNTSLSLAWRYIGPTALSSTSSNEFLNGSPDPIDARIRPYHYFDLTAAFTVNENLSLRIGATNLFDRNPPAIDTNLLTVFGNGNTYPGVYDVIGRRLFAGATVKF